MFRARAYNIWSSVTRYTAYSKAGCADIGKISIYCIPGGFLAIKTVSQKCSNTSGMMNRSLWPLWMTQIEETTTTHSLVNNCVLYVTNVAVEFKVSFSSNSNFKGFNVYSKEFKEHQPQASFCVVCCLGLFCSFPHHTLLEKKINYSEQCL